MSGHCHAMANFMLDRLGSSNGNVELRRERCKCVAWRTVDLGPFGRCAPDYGEWSTEPEPTGRNVTSPALRAALGRLTGVRGQSKP